MKRSYLEIKNDAKKIVGVGFLPITLTTSIYLIIICFMEILILMLSGANEYFEQYSRMIFTGKDISLLEWPQVEPAAILLSAAVLFMIFVLSAGFSGYVMRLSRGEMVGIRSVFEVFSCFGKVIIIEFLTGLLICLGTLAFFVPGIILAYRYRLAVFIMYDNPELGPLACMHKSAELMNGNKMRRFNLDISFIVWVLVSNLISSVVAYPVLDLWLLPYMGVSGAVFYNDLIGVSSHAPEIPDNGPLDGDE